MQALTRINPIDPVRFDGMNGILGEIEARDEDLLNKINVLSKIINNIEATRKLKTYIGLPDLGLTTESTFSEIAAAMPNNSSLEFSNYNPLSWFPSSVTGDRNDVEIKRYSGGVDYIKVKLSNIKTGVWKGYYSEQTGLVWEKMATTTKTSLETPFANGYTINNSTVASTIDKVNNLIIVNLNVKKIDLSLISGSVTVATLPAGYRPSLTIQGLGRVADGSKAVIPVNIRSDGRLIVEIPTTVSDAYAVYGQIFFYL